MREIKFRAWDKTVNKMVDIGEMVVGLTTTAWIKNAADDTSHMIVHGESGEFMQFTGLKDKNGKEIYFGDILATSNDGKDGADVWKIETFGFTVIQEKHGELGVSFSNWAMDDNDNGVYWRDYVEVIGNIYENPELLKNNEK